MSEVLSDDGVVMRRLTCEHGEWHECPPSTLSSIWCRECEDMVPVEFKNNPN